LLLVFNIILLAPMLVLAVRSSELAVVLHTPFQQWLWSVTAIVAVEWLAGGAMAAYALLDNSGDGDSGSLAHILNRLSGAWTPPPSARNPRVHPEPDGAGARRA
jgi:hypothetical protein